MSKLIARQVKQTGPVQGEVWSQYVQRRVMHLLLRHNQQLLRGQFRTFFAQSALANIPLLQLYDSYIRLQLAGETLLNEILPALEIRLGAQNDYTFLLAETPTRGEIDWPRTITRAINESPDQPPQRFETRVLRQNTATPENLLLVALLLRFARTVQSVLREDLRQEVLDDQERLLLLEMDERAERGLDKPYARHLREEASVADLETLVAQAAARLKPGPNPYRDLLTWWEEFRGLHIGQTLARHHLTLPSRRTDEQVEVWLYELWLALEMLDILHADHLLVPDTLEIESQRLRCLFTWKEQRFRFQYHGEAIAEMQELLGWQGTNTLIATYRIERVQPSQVVIDGQVIWQEPPALFAASYPGKHSVSAAMQATLQQLLGGMHLAGAHWAGLFSPALSEPPEGRSWSEVVSPDGELYSERTIRQTSVRLYKIVPDAARDLVGARLRAALQDALEALPEHSAPACYGILLDKETVNASRGFAHKGNVLCPKPHLGAGVFDLVDERLHCLKDPRLCHVYGQPITPPFVIRVHTLRGLEQQQSDLRARADERLREAEQSGNEAQAEQLRSHILLDIGRAVERYVRVHGNTTSLEERFEEWIFGEHWKKHPRCLAEKARESLLSGEYVWEEYKRTSGLNDWAAPAIQYCRALEGEINRRLHDYYPRPHQHYADVGQKGFSRPMTLGFLTTMYDLQAKDPSRAASKDRDVIQKAKADWRLCQEIVRRAKCHITELEGIIRCMAASGLADKRNKLAHGTAVLQSDAQALREAILGSKGKPGMLFWLVENLEPKR